RCHQRPGVAVDRIGPVALQLCGQEPSRPQAEFAGVEMPGEVAAATVLPTAVLAALDDALPDLRHARIERDALCCQDTTDTAPIAAGRRARREAAGVCWGAAGAPLISRRPQREGKQSNGTNNNRCCPLHHGGHVWR